MTAKSYGKVRTEANDRIVWSFGEHQAGDAQNGRLNHPLAADYINENEILVCDFNAAYIINRWTRNVEWEYNTGNQDWCEYLGNDEILIADKAGDEVKAINRGDKTKAWSYSENGLSPRGAIEWDASNNIYAISSAGNNEVRWVDRDDDSTVKTYTAPNTPVGLSRVEPNQADGSATGATILVGYDSSVTPLEEVDYDGLSVVWDYGDQSDLGSAFTTIQNFGHFYNNTRLPHHGIRYGGNQGFGGQTTLIANNELGSVRWVNQNKRLVGTIGSEQDRRQEPRFTPDNIGIVTPHGMKITDWGTLLVADSHGNKVIEVDLKQSPPRQPTRNVRVFDKENLSSLTVRAVEAEGYDPITVYVENFDGSNSIDIQLKVLADNFSGSGLSYLQTAKTVYENVGITVNAGSRDRFKIDTPGTHFVMRADPGGNTIQFAADAHLVRDQ